jgi:hypothetical protein
MTPSGSSPPRQARRAAASALLLTLPLLTGCYSLNWAEAPQGRLAQPNDRLAALFDKNGDGAFWQDLYTPGKSYGFDPGEKDAAFDNAEGSFRFGKVKIELAPGSPKDRALANFTFQDERGNQAIVEGVDLLRLVPRIDARGDLQLPELLLEEYTRHGVTFRREHQEFRLAVQDAGFRAAAERSYRLSITNNCLDPTKWEVVVTSAETDDFGARLASSQNLNQDRILAHSWFYMSQEIYDELVRLKNPGLTADLALASDYDRLTARAEQVRIPWEELRTLAGPVATELVELAHRSGRKLEPIDIEQHYKWTQGIFVNRDAYTTYADVLRTPAKLAEYSDRGFYYPDKPKTFDYAWMANLDQVKVERIAHASAGTLVEITLEGEGSPYALKIGNLDLALLDEQAISTFAFGINLYPAGRRHSPRQATLVYDQDQMPKDRLPYLFLYDAQTGRFVNNQVKGFDRVYLGWDSLDRDVLNVYVLSYERIFVPWHAKVRLADELVDRARVRRFIYGG